MKKKYNPQELLKVWVDSDLIWYHSIIYNEVLCLQMDRKITDPATIQSRAPIGPPLKHQAGTHLNWLTHVGLDATKLVFGVSNTLRLKPVSSATETNYKIAISLEASLDMILCNKRITKALIRLRVCAGWSVPLLFAKSQRQVISRRGLKNLAALQLGEWVRLHVQSRNCLNV